MSKHDDDQVDEKSFNEDELEDIMNEIENLEREFSDDGAEEAPAVKAKPAAAKKAPAPVASHEEHEEEVVEVAPKPSKVVPMHTSSHKVSSEKHSSHMHLSVSGEMQISLEFGIQGQTVHLGVDPQEGLVITMNGGAKFCLPLSAVSVKKTGT